MMPRKQGGFVYKTIAFGHFAFTLSMADGGSVSVCKACGTGSGGKFCPACGQKMLVKRLSVPELLHEAFHFFTHIEHGFFYTLKMLVVAPGKAQRQYIEGNRVKHQKPFSMFFLSATVAALVYYWINLALLNYFHVGDSGEADFFHRYWVLLHACLFPVYSLIVYLCFKKAGFNYGEMAVFQLYTLSFILLMAAVLQLLKFLSPDLQTRYFELPAVAVYTLFTNLNFFAGLKRGTVVALSLLSVVLFFAVAALTQDEVIRLLYKH